MRVWNHVCAVAIIHPEDDPGKVLAEVKVGYPVKVFENGVNLIGGNWGFPDQADHRGPLDTLRAQLFDELTLTPKLKNTGKLVELGIITQATQYQTHTEEAAAADERLLGRIKKEII